MSDNPFSEPEDHDRTVIRPMPGGGRNAARPQRAPPNAPPGAPLAPPPAPPPAAPIPPGADLATIATAQANPLAAAAAPLLQLLARLRNSATPPDQGDMRDRTVREMRAFEKRARDAGVPMDQLRPAHYVLCASLDDVVLNTPWGATGRWSQQTLSATFHQNERAGEGFLEQLRQMRRNPGAFLPVIELMYVCMSLGFMGPYRGVHDGPARMDRVRDQTYALIAGEKPAAAELSPHWAGVAAPYRIKRTRLPVWVVACVALAAVAGLFVWSISGLNAGSDAVYGRMLAAAPAAMPSIVRAPLVQPPPPPPDPPPPGPADRLRATLAAEIGQHLVTVAGTPSTTVLRISAKTLFAPTTATLLPAATPLLERIGQALKPESGTVRVIGFTDNQPTRTVKFPSNFTLAAAQALAVRTALAHGLGDPARLVSEGRADAEPVAPNATPEGREQNRRIDIVLPRQP